MSDPPDRHSIIPNESPITLPPIIPRRAQSHRPHARLLQTPSATTASDNGHVQFTLWNSLERLRKSLKSVRRRRSSQNIGRNVGQVVTFSKARRSTRILLYRTEPTASPEPSYPTTPSSHTPPERPTANNATHPYMVQQQPKLHVSPSSGSNSATGISSTTLGHFVFTAAPASGKPPATPSLPEQPIIPSSSASPSKTLGHFTIVAPTNPLTSASPRDPPSQLSPTKHMDNLCSPVTPRDDPSRRWGIDAPALSPSHPPPIPTRHAHRNNPHIHAQSPSYIPEYRQTHASLGRPQKDIIPDSWFSSPMQKSSAAQSPSKSFTMSPMSHSDELYSHATPTPRQEAFNHNPQLTSPPRRSRNSVQSPGITAEKPPLPTMPMNSLGRRNTHQRHSGMSESPLLPSHQSPSRRNTHQSLSTMSERATMARRNTHQRYSNMSEKASVEMNASMARRNPHQRLSDMLGKAPVPLQQALSTPRETYQNQEEKAATNGHVDPKCAIPSEPVSGPPSQLYTLHLSEVSQTPSADQLSQQDGDESSSAKPKKEKFRHDFLDDFESEICEADLAPNVRPSDDDLSELHRIFPKSHVLQLLHDTSRKATVLKDKLLSSVMYSPLVYPNGKGGGSAGCSRCSGFNVNVSITPRENSSAKGENGLK